MPNWICEREYFATATRGARLFYVVPLKRYHYWTPRGRRADVVAGGSKAKTHGHSNASLGVRTSPFVSFWYVGGCPREVRDALRAPEGCRLCQALADLPPAVRDSVSSSHRC